MQKSDQKLKPWLIVRPSMNFSNLRVFWRFSRIFTFSPKTHKPTPRHKTQIVAAVCVLFLCSSRALFLFLWLLLLLLPWPTRIWRAPAPTELVGLRLREHRRIARTTTTDNPSSGAGSTSCVPPPRSGAASVVVKGRLYMFGVSTT